MMALILHACQTYSWLYCKPNLYKRAFAMWCGSQLSSEKETHWPIASPTTHEYFIAAQWYLHYANKLSLPATQRLKWVWCFSKRSFLHGRSSHWFHLIHQHDLVYLSSPHTAPLFATFFFQSTFALILNINIKLPGSNSLAYVPACLNHF